MFLILFFFIRSKDDPFVLYATMYSGLGTKILTKDLMRSHKVLLDDTKLRNIFQKWLQKHRLVLKSCGQNRFIINVSLYNIYKRQSKCKLHFASQK